MPGYCPKLVGFSCGIQLPIFLGHSAVRADIACADLHPEKPHNSACRLAFDPHRPGSCSLLAERFASASLNFVNGSQTRPLAAMHDLSECFTDPAHRACRGQLRGNRYAEEGKRERHGVAYRRIQGRMPVEASPPTALSVSDPKRQMSSGDAIPTPPNQFGKIIDFDRWSSLDTTDERRRDAADKTH